MSGATRLSFFRNESLRDRNSWIGRPSIALGLPVTISTFASVTLAAGLVALIAFGSYTRRVDLNGTMLPASGLALVTAPSSGWVRHLAVKEGDTVPEGAVLYTIDVDTVTKHGGAQQAIASALMVQRQRLQEEIQRRQMLADEMQEQMRQKIANLQSQIGQADNQTAMQQSFANQLQNQYTLWLREFGKHTVAAGELDGRQQAWMASQASLQGLKSQTLRLMEELIDSEYQAKVNPINARNEIDDLRSKISAIDQDLANSEARQAIEVRAPASGLVTAIAVQPGQTVTSGGRLLTIVPQHDAMMAQLLAPSSAVGFIHAGEKVLLRYSAFPYQKFGQFKGVVVNLSRAALGDQEVQQLQVGKDPTQGGPYYRVTVKPDRQSIDVFGATRQIPANMQVNAFVLLDSRPLYQWALGPIYSLGRAVGSRK
jgi:membrane fusion protein